MRRLIAVGLAAAVLSSVPGPAGAADDPVALFEETTDPATQEPVWEPWAGFIDVRDDDARTARIRGYTGTGARVLIPAGTHRGTGGLARFDPAAEEAWFRYYLRLDAWEASSSGKLPGLAGLYGSSARGCIPSTESNPGWSARTMFAPTAADGAGPGQVRLGTYLYHLGQAGTCGDEILWQPGILDQDRWYCIEGHVRMNTPGAADGLVEAWVDGVPALRWPEVAMRRAGEETVGVRHLWANIYFGGQTVNSVTLQSSIDEMEISRAGRVGCPDPFSDDDGSPFEIELEELYARSVLFGCADGLACPTESLTRAQMAVLLQRALSLPAGPDAYGDDDGHWAEASINALAASGITRGCEVGAYCSEREVSRAEMAVFITRAFELPTGGNRFTDDEGHWAKAEIEALAAAGVTNGCSDASFCPDSPLQRDHAAAFLRRAMGFTLPPATLGFAADSRIGELAPGGFDDRDEPAPDLD
jgi:hypothetical protein